MVHGLFHDALHFSLCYGEYSGFPAQTGQCLPAANIFDPSLSECERDYALGL